MLDLLYRSLSEAPGPPPFVRRESRGYQAALASETLMGPNVSPPETIEEFQAAFENLVVVHRCASLNADAVTAGTFRFYRPLKGGAREELEPGHPLLQVFERPNPRTTGHRLWWAHQLSKELVGNGYAEVVTKPVRQIWNLNAVKMTIDVDRRLGPVRFVYKPSMEPTYFAPEEIWHTWFHNPNDEVYGLPPLRAAARHVAADEALEKAMNAILRNGMRLSGVLTLDPLSDGHTPGGTTPKQVELIINQLKELYSGVKNWGKTLVAAGGRQFTPLNMEPERFGASEFRKWNAGMIMRAFGVWPLLFGDVDTSATRENATTQSLLYHFMTVAPRGKALQEDITYRLIPALKLPKTEGIVCEIDYSNTWAMRELALAEARGNVDLVKEGVITRNEIRDGMGFDPVEWGDSFWANHNVLEVATPDGAKARSSEAKVAGLLREVGKAVRLLSEHVDVRGLEEAA